MNKNSAKQAEELLEKQIRAFAKRQRRLCLPKNSDSIETNIIVDYCLSKEGRGTLEIFGYTMTDNNFEIIISW